MTARETAEAIMADILNRKGLGRLWAEYWELVQPQTREAVLDAWAKLIEARQ